MRSQALAIDHKFLALAQGAYYLATGMWPILHMRSFEKVSGPKRDHWLVKTVGALIAVSGAILLSSARRDAMPREVIALGVGQASALTAVDVVYSSIGRISKIYLMDAAIELLLIAGWLKAPANPLPRARSLPASLTARRRPASVFWAAPAARAECDGRLSTSGSPTRRR